MILFCLFTMVLSVFIECHGFETRSLYGTSGILTNFVEKNSSVNNVTSWNVSAPVDHSIVITVLYYESSDKKICEIVDIKPNTNCKTEKLGRSNQVKVWKFDAIKRSLLLTIKEGGKPFFATFEAQNNRTENNSQLCETGYLKVHDSCYKWLGKSFEDKRCSTTALTIDDRNMNYVARAFLMMNSVEYLWINVTNTIFTAWNEMPQKQTRQDCVRVDRRGIWHPVQKRTVEKNTALMCRKYVGSNLLPGCEDALGLSYPVAGANYSLKIIAKSQKINFEADKAGLNSQSGWIPESQRNNQWIEVDTVLWKRKALITGIATKGIKSHGWITYFKLSVFTSYPFILKIPKTFQGNTDDFNVIYNKIEPIRVRKVRLYPIRWHKKIALRMELYGCWNYSEPTSLGLENGAIPGGWLTSSTTADHSNSSNARLNLDVKYNNMVGAVGTSGWLSSLQDKNQWLQVDFGARCVRIKKILTQGQGDDGAFYWVKSFTVSYSYKKRATFYKEEDQVKEFTGNSDRSTVKENSLKSFIVCNLTRIHPVSWHIKIALRLDLVGSFNCNNPVVNNCFSPMGMEKNLLLNEAISSSSNYSSSNAPYTARLNSTTGWRPKTNSTNEWLQVDFGTSVNISGIATQGEIHSGCFTEKYTLQFSNDKDSFEKVYHTAGEEIFYYGNRDNDSIVMMPFRYEKTARYVRVVPAITNEQHRGCVGLRLEFYGCGQPIGHLTNWTSWSNCNASCNGTKTRNRKCDSRSKYYRVYCSGDLIQYASCDSEDYCGNFTSWSTWSSCSKACGHRQKISYYTGIKTHPGCNGSITLLQRCNQTDWSEWSECNMTCGLGVKERSRSCNGTCDNDASHREAIACNKTINNPHNVNNVEWSSWSDCEEICGQYSKNRTRKMQQPIAEIQAVTCTPCLPCMCKWSNWTDCSATCGNSTQSRERNCSLTSSGDLNCSGTTFQARRCNLTLCPVDGNFTKWSQWTGCSVTCGNGTQQRMRNCSNPAPANGGAICSGPSNETKFCSNQSCPNGLHPVDGNYTTWSNWTTCTLTCGGGNRTRTHNCTNPPPTNGGASCAGNSTESGACSTQHCPIDGNWTKWSDWSYCNRPCGGGQEKRTRSCTNPPPKYGGKQCQGPKDGSKACNTNSCPEAKIRLLVRFTEEIWNNSLQNPDSKESKALLEKIKENVKALYDDSGTVTDVELHSFSNGSVISNFTIVYKELNSTQLIILQENMQKKGLLYEMPLKEINTTSPDVPKSAPRITSIHNVSSTSVRLKWTPIDNTDFNGKPLDAYRVFYQEKNTVNPKIFQQQAVPKSDRNSIVITGLKKHTDYSLRILVSTESGNGVPSNAVDVKTDEDVPSASPPNFKAEAVSSTSIVTSWDTIPQDSVHGILLGYNITVESKKSSVVRQESFTKLQNTSEISGLLMFHEYTVEICGFTSKGCGVRGSKTVKTLEDRPSLPPQNPRTLNLTSRSELKIKWNKVPQDSINGDLSGYVIRYGLYQQTNSRVYDSEVFTENVGSSETGYILKRLSSFSVYEISIAAKTKTGIGPFVKFYGETCRCKKYIKTNYWFLTPYLNRTASGKIQGIFSHIVKDMITWVCGDCENGHGKTIVDFERDGKESSAAKKSMLDVIGALNGKDQVSFPMNGNKDVNRIYGGKPFIPLIQSPGVAMLIVPEPPGTPAWNLFKSTIGSIPFLLFSLLLCYLAGIVIWFLDSGPGSNFPSRFISGTYEAVWWAFITMTTVGYGDRVPLNKLSSRIFTILWTLYGTILISIFTSTVSNSMTTVTLRKHSQIYGKKIAAIQNSSEHRLGLRLNGKFNEAQKYLTLNDILDALVRRQVDAALVDSYVVAAATQKFADQGIQVAKILDRPFGYGVALSIGMAPLESEFRQFLMMRTNQISTIIDRGTDKLRVSPENVSSRSSRLFDPTSVIYRNTTLFFGSMLCFAILCGLVWHSTWRRSKIPKSVSSELILKMAESKMMKETMKRALVDFREKFMSKLNTIREEHREQRRKVYLRDKQKEKQRKKQGKAARKADEKKPEFNLTDLIKLLH